MREREMGSREKDQTIPHQPMLSSLVVRLTDSGGVGGGATGGGSSDYEPGEVRRDQPPRYSRFDRFSDDTGYRMHAGFVSPMRGRQDHRYSVDFDHSSGPRGYGGGIDPGRYQDYSLHYGRGKDSARFSGRGFDGPGYGPSPFRGEAVPRNNAKVCPREGDWFCSDPSCNNLSFARREFCNNCKRPCYSPAGIPRRGYADPPPPPTRRFPGPPSDGSPGRIDGYRAPLRGWLRDDPRDFRAGGPPFPRHEGRFTDSSQRRDQPDCPEDDYGERIRFDRPVPLVWAHTDRGRENFYNERKGYERRPPSPPPLSALPLRRKIRERSRSPIRGVAPPKDYRHNVYLDRGGDDRRGVGRVGRAAY